MRVLIAGGNGFIGSNLQKKFLTDGHKVRVYDHSKTGLLKEFSDVEYVYGEFGDKEQTREALRDVDVLYHLISTTLPETSNNDPAYDVTSNVVSTIRLLELSVEARVKRVVFISSGGTVYGIPRDIPISEDHPTDPISSYGITKLTIEKYLSLFKRLYGLEYVILRLSNPFGPYQNPLGKQGAIVVFMYNILKGRPITIWGDGSVSRDFVYIDDVIDALMLASTAEVKETRIFNIGSGKALTLNELITLIEAETNCKAKLTLTPERKIDTPVNILDTRLAQTYLGWKPKFPITTGLKLMHKWLLNYIDNEDTEG